MQIGIPIIGRDMNQRTGTEVYIYQIVGHLLAQNRRNHYILYVDNLSKAKRLRFDHPNLTYRTPPHLRYWHLRLLAGFIRHKPDVLFVPGHLVPLHKPCPTVITIHDIAFLLGFKGHFPTKDLLLNTLFTMHAIRYADRIIAVSEATKRDVMQRFNLDPSKVSVCYHGCDDIFRPEEDAGKIEELKAKFAIRGDYILFVGVLQPRKNLLRLIEAFAILKSMRGIPHKLVIAGKKGWLCDGILSAAKGYGIEEEVIFTGYVDEFDLPVLMSGASVFVLPSLYEGFGLPALEAMACGTPVIVANVSSLPEVVGDAGLLVDPYDLARLADAIYSVLTDASLRARMRQSGLARARLFSWKKAAERTLAILEEVRGESG